MAAAKASRNTSLNRIGTGWIKVDAGTFWRKVKKLEPLKWREFLPVLDFVANSFPQTPVA